MPAVARREHFADLRKHFSDDETTELVGVISVFGWLNRWNDTMATELETEPAAFAEKNLGMRGWRVGKHRRQ